MDDTAFSVKKQGEDELRGMTVELGPSDPVVIP
jgi:hypothetical protein